MKKSWILFVASILCSYDLIGQQGTCVLYGQNGFISSLNQNGEYSPCSEFVIEISGNPDTLVWSDLESDQQSIGVNIEHSWSNDLTISLTCPSGIEVTVFGGWPSPNSFLGEPVDDNGWTGNVGIGYDYFWSDSAAGGVIDQSDIIGGVLESNFYQPLQPLSTFSDCPLNGTWKLEICDNMAWDNGYLFQWSLLDTTQAVTTCDVACSLNVPTSCADGQIVLEQFGLFDSLLQASLSQSGEVIDLIQLNENLTFNNLAGGDYVVELLNIQGQAISTFTVIMPPCFLPEESGADEICAVKLEPLVNRNVVVWTKQDPEFIATYEIYRENATSAGFTWIGSVHGDSLSEYLDEEFDPATSSTRYNIVAIDSCGAFVDNWGSHRTIHLQSSIGVNNEVNLYWNPYEGLEYSSFEIYRSTNGVDYFQIGSVASMTYAYTDVAPPSGPKWYQIRILGPEPCEPIRSYLSNYISSNVAQLNVVGVEVETVVAGTELLTIRLENGIHYLSWKERADVNKVELYNTYGQKAAEYSILGKREIPLIGLNGIFVAVVIDSNGYVAAVRRINL